MKINITVRTIVDEDLDIATRGIIEGNNNSISYTVKHKNLSCVESYHDHVADVLYTKFLNSVNLEGRLIKDTTIYGVYIYPRDL